MNADLQTALDNYNRIGPGEDLPQADVDAVHEFLISTLHKSGLSDISSIKLVLLLEQGLWNKGWNKGYASAKSHYSAKAV